MWTFLEEFCFGVDKEKDIEKFLTNYPGIDIRKIVQKVDIFNQMVQSKKLEKIKQFPLMFDDDLKKSIRQAVLLSYFLKKYSFRSVFPLSSYIDLLQDDTVKVTMKYKKEHFERRSRSFFSYYLIFKQVESDWVIVESNLLYKVQWREWIIVFYWLLVLFIILYLGLPMK